MHTQLHKQLKAPQQRQRGFTLIELLVVLVILAIITGVVVQNFRGQDYDAAVKVVQADFRTVETALERYRLENRRYPTRDEGLESLVPKFIQRLPMDPWGNPYDYDISGSNYVIISYGTDGQAGGEEEAKDIRSTDQ